MSGFILMCGVRGKSRMTLVTLTLRPCQNARPKKYRQGGNYSAESSTLSAFALALAASPHPDCQSGHLRTGLPDLGVNRA